MSSHWTKPAAYIGRIIRDNRGRAIGYLEPGDPQAAVIHKQRTRRYDRRRQP